MGANPLSRLIKQADAASETASVLLKRTIREIRHDLADLSPSLNLAGSADDREKAYNLVRRRFARLSRLLDTLMADANTAAAKAAAKAAGQMTGLEVKYSPSRAKAICELVTPAQGENLAAVFTDKMSVQLINSLREATVATLRDQAVIGGTLKDMKRDLADRWALAAKVENPTFTDASGRRWDTQTYFQMNVRTNTMRVYNDCLVDDVAREVGTDVMRISTGGDPDCACAAWEGCIISITGATKGLPTYDDARNGGCFHPNCTHTLEYVDEVADADEIALQKGHPAQKGLEDDPDAQDERKYQIDQARYMRDNPGMTQEQARVAVDRDNLAASIQSGLIREDAREIVSKMTDAQVTALCPNGNPPSFEPVKRIPGGTRAEPKHEPERWNHGSRGGVVHIKRDADLAHILSVTKADKASEPRQSDENGHRSARNAPDAWKPATALERATDALMAQIGAKHTDAVLQTSGTNPDYQLSHDAEYSRDSMTKKQAIDELRRRGLDKDAFTSNCQRCVPTWEARLRGYDVEALPKVGGNDYRKDPVWNGCDPNNYDTFICPVFKNAALIQYRRKTDIERQMKQWGDGSRAQIVIAWKRGGAHTFMARQVSGKTVFEDPQGGILDCSSFFSEITTSRKRRERCCKFARIDNLEFNDKIKLSCKPTSAT